MRADDNQIGNDRWRRGFDRHNDHRRRNHRRRRGLEEERDVNRARRKIHRAADVFPRQRANQNDKRLRIFFTFRAPVQKTLVDAGVVRRRGEVAFAVAKNHDGQPLGIGNHAGQRWLQ